MEAALIWNGFWIVAAAASCLCANWLRSPYLQWACLSLTGLASAAWVLPAFGWSFAGTAVDLAALPVLWFISVAALSAGVYWLWGGIEQVGLLALGALVLLGLVSLPVGFLLTLAPHAETVFAEESIDEVFRYRISTSGWAFTNEYSHARVLYRPPWLPFAERSLAHEVRDAYQVDFETAVIVTRPESRILVFNTDDQSVTIVY